MKVPCDSCLSEGCFSLSFYLKTRMHSIRMRTVRNSSRLEGGYLVPGVYLVPGGCTWSQGVGVRGLYLILGV